MFAPGCRPAVSSSPRSRAGAPAPHAWGGRWLLPRRPPAPPLPPGPAAASQPLGFTGGRGRALRRGRLLASHAACGLGLGLGLGLSRASHLHEAGMEWQQQDSGCRAASVLLTSLLRLRIGEQTWEKSLATGEGKVWHQTKVSVNCAILTLNGMQCNRQYWCSTGCNVTGHKHLVYTRASSCWDWDVAGARIRDVLQYTDIPSEGLCCTVLNLPSCQFEHTRCMSLSLHC